MTDGIEPSSEALALAELNHRMANTFQMIGGLLRREADRLPDHAGSDVLRKADAQIQAFALLHDQLRAGRGHTDHPCAAAYLTRLCAHLDEACLRPRAITLTRNLEGPVPQSETRCRHLGLIVTELVLNAVKHAFVGREAGTVGVALRPADAGRTVLLLVADDGVGMGEMQPRPHRGLGFVHALAQALDAGCICDSGPGGTRFSFRFPARP